MHILRAPIRRAAKGAGSPVLNTYTSVFLTPHSAQLKKLSTTERLNTPPSPPVAATPSTTVPQPVTPTPAAEKPVLSAADLLSPLEDAPRAYGKALEQFTPKPLSRPIGVLTPPRSGENNGVDNRTWSQKRDDFVNYDKHLEKRKMLTQKMSTPYFREWSNMRFNKGKTFLAPPRLFKGSHALYFPNLHGETLVKDNSKAMQDTTPVLEGNVSVVSVFSSAWAEAQAASFVGEEKNPELHPLLNEMQGVAPQLVQINVEENALKAGIISLFKGSLRKRIGEANWGKYFVVRKGLTDEARERIGVLNSKVGYVYLLDRECKIRWAGSGVAEEGEREGLVKGVRRLLEEAKATQFVKKTPVEVQKPEGKKPVEVEKRGVV